MKYTTPLKFRCIKSIHVFVNIVNFQLWAIGYPPLIDDCIPAEKLLGMRVTSVWDDVLHHDTFNNLDVVELAVSKHNGAATLR